MVAGNIERTSWVPEGVEGNLHVEWYRPIEAYIPQNVQLIASDGMVFVATSRGLYALNVVNGELVWRFDTQMPLGHSPTVSDDVVYVGGFDRKLHALRVQDGGRLWSFEGAKAGYSTNPLVVNGKVIVGNRDGYLYAIGAHGTPQQGQLLWKFQAGGPINLSAAYKDGTVYFAANDNHAYAVRESDGSLVWKSDRLPGDGYNSYWPVIYGDKVIFSAASGYRSGTPGLGSVENTAGDSYGKIYDLERDELFGNAANGSVLGAELSSQSWSNGAPVRDLSQVINYLEEKPWRRVLIILNRSDGREYTFDSDGDGKPEYAPVTMWGTHSGNRYPPLVGPDGLLYVGNIFQKFNIPQGKLMGWKFGTPYFSQLVMQGAVDEPQAISAGGNLIYRNLCCDRVGSFQSFSPPFRYQQLWTYDRTLSSQAPGYDEMWYGVSSDDPVRLHGNYGTQNGVYHNHGDQNPLVPYMGRLFVHRSNAIIAYGTGQSRGKLPLVEANEVQDNLQTPSSAELVARLESEVEKILAAGKLRPGYYNTGQFQYPQLADYYKNPGETLYTLTRAYPHLSSSLQGRVRTYLRQFFGDYFDPVMYGQIGWNEGEPRDAVLLPPEVQASLASFGKSQGAGQRWSWSYPQFNFYAMWKYAELFRSDPQYISRIYDLAKSRLQVPVPALATDQYLTERPYEHNGYIAGYLGFLELQELAGKTQTDADLRSRVSAELNRLLALRASSFTKDTAWVNGYGSYHLRTLNIGQNFIMLVPELADYLRQNALSKVQAAVNEYNSTAPYWFVSRYNAVVNEGVMQNLYDTQVLQARAYVLRESRQELSKYLDVPAFLRGDLLYINNLIAVIEAQ